MLLASPNDPVDSFEAVRIAIAGGTSFVVVLGTVPVVRRIALARGLTDHPRQDRWHSRATPYLGGVALAVGVLCASALLPEWNAAAAILVSCALALAVVGLIDDFRNLSAAARLLAEAAAAGAAFCAGARIETSNAGVDVVLTVAWLVVVTNAFNLLDNMDGGMASIAVVLSGAIAVVALAEGQVLVGGLAVVTGTACAGFLVFNWYPARVFMGDAGSMFIGFVVAAVALKLRPQVAHPTLLIGLVLLISPALFDTLLVVISRTRASRSIFIGGTDHTSHRLMRLGFGPRETATLLAAASLVVATSGVLVVERRISPIVAGAIVSSAWIAATLALLRVPVYDAPRSTPVDVG